MWCRSWQPKVVTSFARKQPQRSLAFPWRRSASGGKRAKGRVQLACATRFSMISKVSSRCDQISQASFRLIIAGVIRRSTESYCWCGRGVSRRVDSLVWQIDSGQFPVVPCNIGVREVAGAAIPASPTQPNSCAAKDHTRFRRNITGRGSGLIQRVLPDVRLRQKYILAGMAASGILK